ncbi:MAG: hypothetical protein AAFZ15_29935 [Bacteroidota bacterium]
MKKIIFTLMVVSIAMQLAAQCIHQPERYFSKGQSDLQIGIGLVPVDVILDKATVKTMPHTVELNRMMGDKFSMGLFYSRSVVESQLQPQQDGVEQQIEKDFRQTGLKFAFHFNQYKNFDSYGGFSLAFNHQYFKVVEGDEAYLVNHLNFQPKRTGIGYSGFVGTRLAIRKNWSAFAELGLGGNSFLTCGIGYRL